jgi:LmbE family N-acetylglucosaminyl deacetylase
LNVPAWDVICLSPHADDAVYSIGGTLAALAAAGRRVLVVTVFSGEGSSPFADELHQIMGLTAENVAAVRRAEDEAALARLGVARREGGLTDAIYRRPDLYFSRETLLSGMPRDEPPLEELVAALSAESPGALLLGPLAIGGHVDHVLVSRALRGERVGYWEDFPYAAGRRVEGRAPLSLGVPPDVEARVAASLAYRSQISLNFGDAPALAALLRGNPEERLWR